MKRLFTLTMVGALALGACSDDNSDGSIAGDTTGDTGAPQDTTPAQVGPLANVYAHSPVSTPQTEQVTLAHLTSEDGTLVGPYANVRNCIQDVDNGVKVPLDLGGFVLNLVSCTPTKTAVAGDDGSYLHIGPPATPADDDGTFAEIMMYHHMQVIHDYFKDTHGLTDRDEPLDAIVNVQAYVELCEQWTRLPNAAFIPKESLDQLPIPVDLGVDDDSIVFSGTESKNFSFDAGVIYHEYTHAMVGATRLNAAFLDAQGLNNLPGALNEAYADYFAMSILGESEVGGYALNDLDAFKVCGIALGAAGSAGRDLVNDRVCPDDLTTEVHADSEIFSAALWDIREALGVTDADRVILQGVISLTQASGFTAAAEATVDKAEDLLGAEVAATVKEIFDARQIINCPRVVPADRVGVHGLPLSFPGPGDLGGNPFGSYTPGYAQVGFEVPAGTVEIEVDLDVSAGGGFGGGGGSVELELAFKHGDDPITYRVIPGGASNDALVVVPVVDGKATLSGACVKTGAWTISLHNRGGAVNLSKVTVTTRGTPEAESSCP